VKPWVKYTIIRVLLFAGSLAILLVLGVPGWIAAIIAAVVGLCVAYLFFRPQRDELIASVRKNEESQVEPEDFD
jgi:type IV secretory pathway TrbD component